MSVFPYSSKNLLRTFRLSFSVRFADGSSSTYYFVTKKMFDASDINYFFNMYSRGSRIYSTNILPFLNSLLPFLLRDSDDFIRLYSLINLDKTFFLYIYNFSIHTLTIY